VSDYALEGPKWASQVVTWSFAPAGGAFTGAIGAAYQDTVRAAIARWAGVVNLTLKQVSDAVGVDIRVGWGSFAGSQVGQTDYSYRGGSAAVFVPGTKVRLEDPNLRPVGTTPTSTYQGTSTTLYEVMLHEFGHALGLDHSTDSSATMYPIVGPANANLDASDIAGIQLLYGAPAGSAVIANTAPNPSTGAAPSPQVVPSPIELTGEKVAVYRFFDTTSGTQFLTASTSERDTVIATRADLTYEGLGLTGIAPSANDPNAAPVFRFFNSVSGTHFLTASQGEKNTIAATRPDMVFEGSSFGEHRTQQAGDAAVYRFFDTHDGTHFFTSSASERASIIATRTDLTDEGIAFYAPTPS